MVAGKRNCQAHLGIVLRGRSVSIQYTPPDQRPPAALSSFSTAAYRSVSEPTDRRTDGRIEESDSSSALSWSVVTDASAKTWTSSAPPASVEFTGDRGGRAPLTVTHTSARRLPAVIYRVAGDRQQDSSSLWVHCLSFHTLIASLSAQLPRLLTGH